MTSEGHSCRNEKTARLIPHTVDVIDLEKEEGQKRDGSNFAFDKIEPSPLLVGKTQKIVKTITSILNSFSIVIFETRLSSGFAGYTKEVGIKLGRIWNIIFRPDRMDQNYGRRLLPEPAIVDGDVTNHPFFINDKQDGKGTVLISHWIK